MKVRGLLVRILFTGIVLILTQSAIAQIAAGPQIISGVVQEEGSRKPIRNVSVFFDGTLTGSTTDSTGNFTLYSQTNSKLPILVSGIGYHPQTITDYPLGKKLVIQMKAMAYDLDAVTVMADDGMSRKEKLKIFRREFLGSSPNAKNCVIQNEDDLRFTYSSKTHVLKATCDKPIVVQNKSLGYTLNFLLSNFTYDGQQTAFYGSQFFKEEPGNGDPEKIKKARKNTYLGSQLHFVRALWNNKLGQNGFEVIRYLKQDSSAAGRDKQYVARDLRQLTYDSLVVSRNNQKFLQFDGLVKITYRTQISMMEGKGRSVAMEGNGYIDPAGIVWKGVIGMQRAGDLLPLEFDVETPVVDQKETDDTAGSSFTASAPLDTLHNRMPFEKLYIHLDKPYYTVGDTVRMKAYLLDAAEGKGSNKSGIVYIELANDSNKVFYRRMLPMGFGLGTGNIILSQKDIPEGSYTLRAYTNLMRNFGNEISFQKNFYISSTSPQSWLVNTKAELTKRAEKDNVQLAMQFNQLNKEPVRRRTLDIRIVDGDRVMQRGRLVTDLDGKLNMNFNLPENVSTRNISLIAVDPVSPAYKVTIPVEVSRPQNIDLQFMPEGGSLVTGISSRVGFKAIGEDGNGTEVSGKVYNGNNEEVGSFASSYKGMGSFEMKPTSAGAYTAKVMVNGTSKSFPVALVKNTGSVLTITNPAASDSVIVTVATNFLATSKSYYHLIGQSGGKIYFEENIPVSGNTTVKTPIRKDLFPSGLVRFTLLNPDKQPVNERLVFIDNHDNLEITLKAAKPSFKTRDSISIAIQVKDDQGRPVEGSFSMAVTDDSQVHTDSLGVNILTSMLLTSGLQGTVEQPAHYLNSTARAAADLDNLLLTQGWIGYNWNEVFNAPATLAYLPEQELVINGKAASSDKKSPATAIQILSLRPESAKAIVTADDGSFSFAGLPVAEDLKFFITAKNKNGRNANVDIQINEAKPVTFKPLSRHFLPWYVNSDSALLRQANTRALKEKNLVANGMNLLREVTIAGRKAVNDSKNLNGLGEADQVLDRKDLEVMKNKTLADLMQAQVKGFGVGVWPSRAVVPSGIQVKGMSPDLDKPGPKTFTPGVSGGSGSGLNDKSTKGTVAMAFAPTMSYKIFDKEMHLIIDGTDVETLYQPTPGNPMPTADPQLTLQKNINPSGDYILERNTADPTDRQYFIRQIMERIRAEDVKGIEVMSNPKYNTKYKEKYAWKIAPSLSMISADFAYVEVTTDSGMGAYYTSPPGVYLHTPISYVSTKAFYRPKYTAKASPLADLRSTIHWESDIATDENGKATVSFYSANRPGTYSIIMEGSNMNGMIGRKTGTIQIK